MNLTAFDLVLISLASYRISRLITKDTLPLVRRPREWIERKFPEGHWFSELISCPFCTSVYVVLATGAAWLWGGEPGQWIVTAFAVAGAVALAFAALDKD